MQVVKPLHRQRVVTMSVHTKEQQALVADALTIENKG